MLPVVVIALSLSLIVMFLIFLVAVLDVAFVGGPVADSRGRLSREWQPPLIHDDELFAWAAAAAKSVVRRRLPTQRGPSTAKEIAGDVCAGATYAIERSPHQGMPCTDHTCSSCRDQMIGVTAPEVLAIVETIRTKRPSEMSRIRNQASENAKRVADMDHEQYEAAQIVCPLLCTGNTCAANGCRPLHCRGWRPLSKRESEPGLLRRGAGTIDPYAYTVSQGVEDGLAAELTEVGLDGSRYELNSALAVALATPNAAKSWADGEPVFATCKRLQRSPLKPA